MAARRKLETVQYLRAVAAVGVIVFHALGLLGDRTGFTADWSHLGAAGVDLFFVLSGFIMWVTAIDRDEDAGTFVFRRITRIVPLYWLVTTAVLFIQIAKPGLMRNGSHDPLHFLLSYLFIACRHPSMPEHFWPPVIPGWTLNYEMLFYGIVSICLGMRKGWRMPFVCGSILLPVCVGLALHPDGLLAFYTSPLLLEFLFGIGVGALFTSGYRQSQTVCVLLLLTGAVLFVVLGEQETPESQVLTWGLPLAILVQGAVYIPVRDPGGVKRIFTIIGDASYSIYLTQFIVIPAVTAGLQHFLAGNSGMWVNCIFVGAIVLCTLVVGVANYYLVELPIMRGFRILLQRGRRGLSSSAATPPGMAGRSEDRTAPWSSSN
jgi:exopolysaccharide production protein ExoZ